jgi:plastocyanin
LLADRSQLDETASRRVRCLRLRFAATVCSFVAASSLGCAHPNPTREITLVARGMSFVLQDAPDQPNPTIHLRAGERIRLVLRNEAPGLLHDIEIPDWDVRLDQIRSGQTTDLTFVVPAQAGRHEYRCRPHSTLMRGVVEVVP